MPARLTRSALAIADGLIRTHRARRLEFVGDVLRLERKHGGGFYWVLFNGSEPRRGLTLGDSEVLQEQYLTTICLPTCPVTAPPPPSRA